MESARGPHQAGTRSGTSLVGTMAVEEGREEGLGEDDVVAGQGAQVEEEDHPSEGEEDALQHLVLQGEDM